MAAVKPINRNWRNRAEETRAFLERLWRLENDERPGFVIGETGPGGEGVAPALFATGGEGVSLEERLKDPKLYLEAQLEEIRGQEELRGDFVPALCPSLGVVAIPSAFGCPVRWFPDDFPAALPAIGPGRPVDTLEPPSVRDGLLGTILDYTRFFREETGLPIRVTDIQGPLDSAALVWGHTDFFMAMLTDPQGVHRLLDLVTDLTIRFVKEQRKAAGEFVPSLFQPWMPDGTGLSVSNDEGVMISPEMHDDFCLPYLNRISRAFGGIFIHSCGNWAHLLPSISKVEELKGVEFGAGETEFADVSRELGGKAVLSTRVGLNMDIHFRSMKEYVLHILEHKKTNRGLFVQVDITNGIPGEDWEETPLEEIYRLMEEDL